MAAHDWVQLGFIVAGVVFQVALAIDRWVHQQGADAHDLIETVKKLAKDMDDMHQLIDSANDRLSDKMSDIQKKVGALELEVARLKALDEGRQRHD